jgi:hypothetical protein
MEAERDVIGHVDLEQLFCSAAPYEVCWASETFFYTMPASSSSSFVESSGSSSNSSSASWGGGGGRPGVLSCCEASRVLLHELGWQDALVRRGSSNRRALHVDVCTNPGSRLLSWGAAARSNVCAPRGGGNDLEKVNKDLLHAAKDTILNSQNGACFASFVHLVEGETAGIPRLLKTPGRNNNVSSFSEGAEDEETGGEAETTFARSPFWDGDSCWLTSSLGILDDRDRVVGEADDRVCAALHAVTLTLTLITNPKQ